MRLLLLLAIIISMPSLATDARVERMATNCVQAMNSGLCRIALDPKDYPNDTIPVIVPAGKRLISTRVYLALRATGFAKDDQGRWLMCEKVYASCEDWDSDECVAVRTMGWRY